MAEIKCKFDEERQLVVIERANEESLALRADQFEAFLDSLLSLRSVIAAKSGAAGPQVKEAVANPQWFTEITDTSKQTLLQLKDPRFGWLAYSLPRASTEMLVELLSAQLEAAGSRAAH